MVRLDSANVNSVARTAMKDWFKMCHSLALKLELARNLLVERWRWFLRRGIAIVTSKYLSLDDLAQLTTLKITLNMAYYGERLTCKLFILRVKSVTFHAMQQFCITQRSPRELSV